ncbi:Glycosyl transferase, family 39 [Candidatus Sulfotelmatobacter kueseliae]|uniref:Glycosyl transferase, family 39 n=1 Tax=Candidatus Sulfotelmatobacter kueseliae TaxID=2042962 RepID=A0A2U3JW58_9BACT|nr:Glycosyl transferase, family 39 [Candidatus Sulfotelmatobacter kueseliae]
MLNEDPTEPAAETVSIQQSTIIIQQSSLMTLRTRTDALLIFGFCAFLFFYGAGQFGLIGADEPRYAQVAREMLDRRDWITPVLNGQAWLEKPPLYYWQAMLAYSALGVSDVAARLPSAIDATLLVIAVYLFFRRFRRGVEVDAALITASGAGVIGYARAASMDMALAASFSVGMLAWWAWRESGRRIYLAAFYVCMALGMLAKGPVAPVLAAAIIVLFAIAAQEWRLIVRTLWLPGILLFCAIALPWYVAVEMRNPQFFREFILEHNLARFSTDVYHHRQPFWYYLPVTLLALVPWTVFVIAAFAASVRAWWTQRKSVSAEPDFELQFNLFACVWLVVPVVFFSISRSKLPGYILPAVPAGAVLLADYLRRHLEREEPVPKWMAVLHALVASAPIVPALLVGYAVAEHRLPAGRPMLIALAIAFVLCAAIALTLASRLQLRMLRFVTLIPVVLAVAAVLKLGTTAIDQTLSARPLAAELATVETRELPVAVCGTSRELEYGLAFYRNQTIARCEFGPIPTEEHLLVAPPMFRYNIAEKAPGRRVMFLGHYAPQDVDYYWVAASARS